MANNNKKQIIFIFVSAAGFILLCLLSSELSVRLSLWLSGRRSYVWLPDYYLGVAHAANSKFIHKEEFSNEFITKRKINSLGLVGEEISVEKPEGTFRILVLGDSFTEGLQVGEGKNYCERLQYLLNQNFSFPGKSFEVINAGTSGFSPIAEYLFLKRELIKLKSDIIILQIFANDVFEDNKIGAMSVIGKDGLPVKINRFFIKKYLSSPNPEYESSQFRNIIYRIEKFILNRSVLFQCLDRAINRNYKNSRINREMIKLAEFNDDNQFFIIQEDNVLFRNDRFRSRALSNTERYILAIKNLAEDNSARFFMFYIPTEKQLKLSHYGSSGSYFKQKPNYFLNDKLRELSRKNNICYLDSLSILEENKDEDLYFNKDGHLKETGHALIVKALFDSLNKFGLVNTTAKVIVKQ